MIKFNKNQDQQFNELLSKAFEVGKKYNATFSNKFKKIVVTEFEVINKFKGRDNKPMLEILTEDGRRANIFEEDLKPLML